MDYVILNDLATELGMDKSNFRKYVLRAGFSPVKIRTPQSRNQLVLALTPEEAEAIRELRERNGFTAETALVDNGNGWFYVIQLVPDLDPKRIKLGFASNVETRLQAHRTAAPTAKLVKAWPCKRVWEWAAMDCMTQNTCTLIASEVFTCDDIDLLKQQGDAFFALMPKPIRP